MKDYEKFFSRMADYTIESRFYENGESFQVEELYEAFKARLIHELVVDHPSFNVFGLLRDE
jgi:hypothetical protein